MRLRQGLHAWRQYASKYESRPSLIPSPGRALAYTRDSRRSYHEIPKCPPSDCSCASIPDNLEIDRETLLKGRTPFYSTHLVTCTRRSDWTSKTEDDPRGWFARGLKDEYILGNTKVAGSLETRIGTDSLTSFKTPLISCSSFRPTLSTDPAQAENASLYAFPQFKYVKFQRSKDQEKLQYEGLDDVLEAGTSSDEIVTTSNIAVQELDGYAILICGHGGRDQRCGVIAPLLSREFRKQLHRRQFLVEDNPPQAGDYRDQSRAVRIAQISHVGGHKWAGNVIIYVSPKLVSHPLAGKGIWLGRVEPQHVQGIISETMIKGRVITELLRGVVEFSEA